MGTDGRYGAEVPAEQTSALTLAVVAGGFTAFGALAKIAFDARREQRTQRLQRFADERRERTTTSWRSSSASAPTTGRCGH